MGLEFQADGGQGTAQDPAPADRPGPLGARGVAAHLGSGWRHAAPAAWLEGWRPVRCAIEGGWTEVVAMGEGPTLVLLPPLPGFKESWIACACRLAREFRVVTFDLRDHFTGRARWGALLQDLERVLDLHAPGRVGLVGHSLGGALAQRWALAHPERVAALVLSSSFARVTNPRGNRWARFVEQPLVLLGQRWLPAAIAHPIARGLARRGAWVYDARCDDAVLELVRIGIRDLPWSAARRSVELALAHDTRASLPQLTAPTLIVIGERENPFYREAQAELLRLLPRAETAESPGTSHLHPLSHPDWLAARIAAWMRGRVV